MKTWPDVGSSSPEMVRSSVDLPQPDGPTNTTNSPSPTSRSTFLMTGTVPKLLLTPRSCRSAIIFPPGHSCCCPYDARKTDFRNYLPYDPQPPHSRRSLICQHFW